METTQDNAIEPLSVQELMGAEQDPAEEIVAFRRANYIWKLGNQCLIDEVEYDSKPTYPIL